MENRLIQATRVAQAILTTVRPGFLIDGHWGGFTEQAFQTSPIFTQKAISAALKSFDTSSSNLRAAFLAEKALSSSGSVERARALAERGNKMARPDVVSAIANAALKTGVNSSILMGMAGIESNFDPSASNGKSVGLLQLQPAAWGEAKSWLADKGVVIGSWATQARNPEQNALAGAAYVQINLSRLKRLGYTGPVTPAVVYLAHQQGADGFMELWRASAGLPAGSRVFVSPEALRRNPPPDGGGAVKDKGDFFRRWIAVATKKIV